jgi:hypothetical protein
LKSGFVNGVCQSESPKSLGEDAAGTSPDYLHVISSATIEELNQTIVLILEERDKAGASAKDKREAQVRWTKPGREKETRFVLEHCCRLLFNINTVH